MGTLVSYRLEDSIATITMDDGKVNALSPDMLAELDAALDRATADRAAVVLTGRPGVFSAGFDLGVIKAGGRPMTDMVRAGFELAARVLSFPAPVLIACPGHAVAMGAFLLMSADYRIGVTGPYRYCVNEVAIGLTVPQAAIEITRQRLTPAHFCRAVILAEAFSPPDALAAGFVDRLAPDTELADLTASTAARLAVLDRDAHRVTKLRARESALTAIRAAIDADYAAARA